MLGAERHPRLLAAVETLNDGGDGGICEGGGLSSLREVPEAGWFELVVVRAQDAIRTRSRTLGPSPAP